MKVCGIFRNSYDGILSFAKCTFFMVMVGFVASICPVEAANYKYMSDVIREVKDLRSERASNHEIAYFVNEIVNARVRAVNMFWNDTLQTTIHHTIKPTEEFYKWRDQNIYSVYFSAVWTWENRVGQCEEHAKLTYYILKKAGLDDVRMVGWNRGNKSHLFVVIGLEEDQSAADIANPHYWPDQAFAIDPWQGKVMEQHEAWVNSYIGDKGRHKLEDSTPTQSSKIPKYGLKPLMWNTYAKTWECKEPYVWDHWYGCVRYPCPIDRRAKHLRYDYRIEDWICYPPEQYQLDEKSGRCVTIDQSRTFNFPTIKGRRIDWCLSFSRNCGWNAAHAFCRAKGYKKASAWDLDHNIGRTICVGTGELCTQKGCDGFSYVTCVGEEEMCNCDHWRNRCEEWAYNYGHYRDRRDKALAKGHGVKYVEDRMNNLSYQYNSNCCDECLGPID